MKVRFALLMMCGISLSACQTTSGTNAVAQADEKREEIVSMADRALDRLYAEKPEARKEIEKAAGYGVFNVTAVNVILLVGSKGPGVIVDNKTGQKTFMNSMRAGTGPGVGYQELYQIFVFKSESALAQFKMGDKGGGDVVASTTVGSSAVQVSANPSISVYQLSEKGYALQANWGGAVYVVDDELNKPTAATPQL